MSDLEPLKRPDPARGNHLGQELLKQLQQAVESGDYNQIQMVASQPRDRLDSDSRGKIERCLESFSEVVAGYVFDTLPSIQELKAKRALSIADAVSLLVDLIEVRGEIDKIKQLHIVPESKIVILETRHRNTHKVVAETIVKFGSDLREQFEFASRDLLERIRVEMARTPRDTHHLRGISGEVTSLFKQSCIIEDHVPGWKLGSDRRGFLRIAAKELTNHGGVPTPVPFREDKKAHRQGHRRYPPRN